MTYFENVSVARGNLVLADHGCEVVEWHPGDPANPAVTGIQLGTRAYRFRLKQGPLSFRVPLPKDTGTLTVGHFNPAVRSGHGDRMFRGLIGEVRIFGSRIDGAGALPSDRIRATQRGGK